jgi:hypothetical protein
VIDSVPVPVIQYKKAPTTAESGGGGDNDKRIRISLQLSFTLATHHYINLQIATFQRKIDSPKTIPSQPKVRRLH